MLSNLLRVSTQELASYLKDPQLLIAKIETEEDKADSKILFCIDEAWDGINFLLTGENLETDHELGEVMMPDLVIDDKQDLGAGPAMYLLPERVKELYDQIFNLNEKDLKSKYNASKMDELEIIPGNWQQEDEMFTYLHEYFEDVVGFYADAVKDKEAIIIYLEESED